MKSVGAAVTALVMIWTGWAQTTGRSTRTSGTTIAPGIISSRVFAITKGGDLKPARLAHVYLIGHRENQSKDSAFFVFLDERVKGAKQLRAEATCREELLVIEEALKATAQWALKNDQQNQFISTEADEEGNFTLRGAPAGTLTLAILGRAGINEAYWEADVLVIPRLPATILQPDRLKTPEKTCPTL